MPAPRATHWRVVDGRGMLDAGGRRRRGPSAAPSPLREAAMNRATPEPTTGSTPAGPPATGPSGARPSVTALLGRAAGGDRAAFDRAVALVYDELRGLAHAQLRRERPGHTLDTGALVHEAYLRLGDGRGPAWEGRGHFLAVAAAAMRRVLVDHARRAHAAKRGGAARPLPLDEALARPAALPDDRLLALDEALARLATLDPRQARVVECRYFGGLTEEETAHALGVGLRTVKRDWAKARAWLYRALHPADGPAGAP